MSEIDGVQAEPGTSAETEIAAHDDVMRLLVITDQVGSSKLNEDEQKRNAISQNSSI
jgi:hypothetical protein